MKIVYFDKDGQVVLVEMEHASIEELAKSIDLHNKHESIVGELICRFEKVVKNNRQLREENCRLRREIIQQRMRLYGNNFIAGIQFT